MNSPVGAGALPPVLEVQNLIVGYEQNVLIHNLFFSLPGPCFLAVAGHNGSGKTTLFKALLGQIPFKGAISVMGQPVQSYTPQQLAGVRSYLPQKNELRFPVAVRDLVVMGRYRFKRFFEHYSAADYDLANQALAKFGLLHLAERDINLLSGGEQQLVWMAQLMVQDAKIWLLDEPAQQLDIYNRSRLYRMLGQAVEQHQRTVLCITHDIYNLYNVKGFLLNVSKPKPKLEPLSRQVVEENLAFLEKGEEG